MPAGGVGQGDEPPTRSAHPHERLGELLPDALARRHPQSGVGQLAPGAGFKGDRLPGVSEHQFTGSFDQRWSTAGGRALLFHLDAAYRGEFANRLSASAANYRLFDAFWVLNASVGMELGEGLEVQMYARNLTDEKGISSYVKPTFKGAGGAIPPPEYSFESMRRPRTLGVRVSWQF
jgi:outer membrane receptor protein involved in Fe transport